MLSAHEFNIRKSIMLLKQAKTFGSLIGDILPVSTTIAAALIRNYSTDYSLSGSRLLGTWFCSLAYVADIERISSDFKWPFYIFSNWMLQRDQLFIKGKYLEGRRHLLQNRCDDRSADGTLMISSCIVATDSYRLVKDAIVASRPNTRHSDHVFDNDSYRPRGTKIELYVPESPLASRFTAALHHIHK